MTIDVELTQAEFTEAWLVANRRVRWFKTIYFSLIGIFALYLGYTQQTFHGGILFGLGVGLLAIGLMTPLALPAAVKKLWKKHPVYGELKQYTFDDQGFSSQSYNSSSITRWHAFSHWKQTPRLFLLYFGPSVNFAIPKRCLANDDQIKWLSHFLQQMIGRKKYAKPVQAFPVELPALNADA